MNPTDFLRDRLLQMSRDFPYVNIKCGYNQSIAAHVVEISPDKEFWHNDGLGNAWAQLSFQFQEKFLSDDIVFVPSSSPMDTTGTVFEFNALQAAGVNGDSRS